MLALALNAARARPLGAPLLLLASLLVAALVGVPILGVLSNLFALDSGNDTFAHLWATVMPEYLFNSFGITLIVAVLAGAGGGGCAWFVAGY